MFSKAEEVSYPFRGLMLGFLHSGPREESLQPLSLHSALGVTGQTHISPQDTCGTVAVTVKSQAFSEVQGTALGIDGKQ